MEQGLHALWLQHEGSSCTVPSPSRMPPVKAERKKGLAAASSMRETGKVRPLRTSLPSQSCPASYSSPARSARAVVSVPSTVQDTSAEDEEPAEERARLR